MASTKAIIVLAGSKQANKLGNNIKKATKDMTEKSITLSFAHDEYILAHVRREYQRRFLREQKHYPMV